jgi:type IV secretory pathway ATPase VirB11/archaellum biosynthesis ATPase
VLVAVGEVEAGVDLANPGPEDVEVIGETAAIRLPEPEPEALSSSLDEEKTAVYDRDQGLLRLRPDDALVGEARRDAEAEITAAAEENGILDYATINAEDSIRAFVTTLGFEEVEFVP